MDVRSDKLKRTFNSIFKSRSRLKQEHAPSDDDDVDNDTGAAGHDGQSAEEYSSLENGHSDDEKVPSPFVHRALPPLPAHDEDDDEQSPSLDDAAGDGDAAHAMEQPVAVVEVAVADDLHDKIQDYAASIERVKDCGWYWGPVPGETAEKLLAVEPDGSFIVRDSSDEHYIFSLTFKLNGLVRHVRIEHDQGNFSFGCLQKFKCNTIVDFIEDAVAHSRSGRFLFFLHRQAEIGPLRVQLLHPVSRFKQIQSLQHLCRFILLKYVRRDLIAELPLPARLKTYLNTPHYYTEDAVCTMSDEQS